MGQTNNINATTTSHIFFQPRTQSPASTRPQYTIWRRHNSTCSRLQAHTHHHSLEGLKFATPDDIEIHFPTPARSSSPRWLRTHLRVPPESHRPEKDSTLFLRFTRMRRPSDAQSKALVRHKPRGPLEDLNHTSCRHLKLYAHSRSAMAKTRSQTSTVKIHSSTIASASSMPPQTRHWTRQPTFTCLTEKSGAFTCWSTQAIEHLSTFR